MPILKQTKVRNRRPVAPDKHGATARQSLWFWLCMISDRNYILYQLDRLRGRKLSEGPICFLIEYIKPVICRYSSSRRRDPCTEDADSDLQKLKKELNSTITSGCAVNQARPAFQIKRLATI